MANDPTKAAKNTAPVKELSIEDIDDTGMHDEQTGFSPYWAPDEGKRFFGRIVDRDESDPEFIRYIVEASCLHVCERGDKANHETVPVHKGEFFTVSEYKGLGLGKYLGFEVLVRAKNKRPIKVDGKTKELWEWSLKVDGQSKALLTSERKALLAAYIQSQLINRPGVKAQAAAQSATGLPQSAQA